MSFQVLTELKRRLRHTRMSWVTRNRFGHKTVTKKHLFIAGVQRSGTNLIHDIVETSPDIDSFREHDPRAYVDYALRDDAMVRRALQRSRAPVVALKLLLDADRVAEHLGRYEGGRAIWMYRRLDDTVTSNMAKWPGGRNRLEDVVAGRIGDDWRGRGMTPETMAQLRAVYRPDLSDAEAQALFWWRRHQLFFDQALTGRADVLLMNYDALAADPARWTAVIGAFFEVSLPTAAAELVTPSAATRRAPPEIGSEIRALCDAQAAQLDATWRTQPLVSAALQGAAGAMRAPEAVG